MRAYTATTAKLKTFTNYNMERNTLTAADKLQVGDRFYKQNDKHKKVLVIVDHKAKQTHWQTYKHWCIPASIYDIARKQEVIDRYATPIKKDTAVIFLRHCESPVI